VVVTTEETLSPDDEEAFYEEFVGLPTTPGTIVGKNKHKASRTHGEKRRPEIGRQDLPLKHTTYDNWSRTRDFEIN